MTITAHRLKILAVRMGRAMNEIIAQAVGDLPSK